MSFVDNSHVRSRWTIFVESLRADPVRWLTIGCGVSYAITIIVAAIASYFQLEYGVRDLLLVVVLSVCLVWLLISVVRFLDAIKIQPLSLVLLITFGLIAIWNSWYATAYIIELFISVLVFVSEFLDAVNLFGLLTFSVAIISSTLRPSRLSGTYSWIRSQHPLSWILMLGGILWPGFLLLNILLIIDFFEFPVVETVW